ncbi:MULTISPECIES: ECF transporter S component [Fictibacillus]|nr:MULTISPECIES: ECF transporter S component [Fictibacillus]RXZ02244.1 riboflavin transporter FmnP [Fictibacillus sp. S7]SCC15031.1 Riboflavin transporter FmnP [Fictibacillus enclensis]
MHKGKVYKMVAVSMLSSIAYVLQLLDFPFPGLPAFLQIDFSEVPALLAAIVFGPLAGLAVEGIKNVLHYGIVGNMTGVPVGEMANFIAGTIFIVPVSYFYRKHRSTKSLSAGLIVGTVMMTLMMALLNYVLILPAYTWFLNSPQMSGEAMLNLILVGIAPFNVIKGMIITILFVILYSRLQPWLNKQYQHSS